METVKVTITIEVHAQHDGNIADLEDSIARSLDATMVKLANNERKDIGLLKTAMPKVKVHD